MKVFYFNFFLLLISLLSAINGRCLSRHISTTNEVYNQDQTWQKDCNNKNSKIYWQFTTKDSRVKLKKLVPTFNNILGLRYLFANHDLDTQGILSPEKQPELQEVIRPWTPVLPDTLPNLNLFICGETKISDIDSNSYNTVLIGTQCWTSENLRVSRYRNGNLIPTGLSASAWYKTKSGACATYWLEPDYPGEEVDSILGKLYNFYAVVDPRGLCPTGWHVPSDAEWRDLANYLNPEFKTYLYSFEPIPVVGGKMKSILFNDDFSKLGWWVSPNTGATNSSGFTALPAGQRAGDAKNVPNPQVTQAFCCHRENAFFWSSTPFDPRLDCTFCGAVYYFISSHSDSLFRKHGLCGTYAKPINNKAHGYSVRCLRD